MTEARTDARPNRYLLLSGVALGGVLAPLNSTMIAVALPELREDFGIGHGELGWIISAYLIAMAVAQPIGGRLSDQLGRSRVFRAGLLAFLAFSLAATFAPTFPVLVFLRTGQAIAGAVLIPNGMAMLREMVPVRELGRTNGLYSAVIGTSAAVGPLVGAGLLALGSWRLLFLVNVPVVALALLLLARIRYQDTPTHDRASIDWLGAALFTGLLVAVTFVLGSIRGGSGVVMTVTASATSFVLGGFFALRQLTTKVPITEWGLFRKRTFSAATSHVMLTNLVMYTTLLTIPFFIREVQDKGSASVGLLLGAMSVLMAVMAPISGRLSDAFGRRWPAFVGSWLVLAGSLLIAFGLDTDVSFAYMATALAVLGCGVGMSFGPATTAAIESAPRALAGSAAGANNMMRYIGSIVGAGVLAGLLNTAAGSVPGIDVFRLTTALVAGMAALTVVTASMIHRFPVDVEDGDTVDAQKASPLS